MNKDELVGYIQGLLDMSKRSNEIILEKYRHGEDLPKIESELLELINKALAKHRENLNGEIKYFNKKADEYTTPNEIDPIWNGPSEDLLPDQGPQISNHGEFGKPNNEAPYGQD